MSRTRILLLAALGAALLALPATAQAQSGVRLRGTVTLKDASHRLVSVRATRRAVTLRVQSSLQRIRVGQRVELRGSTLRTQGDLHVLASHVSIVRSRPLSGTSDTTSGQTGSAGPSAGDDDQGENEDQDNDELEVKGTISSLSPLTVRTPGGPKSSPDRPKSCGSDRFPPGNR